MAAAPPAPGLSARPLATLAFGWNGGFPPRKIESLTPRRVINRPRQPGGLSCCRAGRRGQAAAEYRPTGCLSNGLEYGGTSHCRDPTWLLGLGHWPTR